MKRTTTYVMLVLAFLLLGTPLAVPMGAGAASQDALVAMSSDPPSTTISISTETKLDSAAQSQRRCVFSYEEAVGLLKAVGSGNLIGKIFALPTAGEVLWCWIQPTPVE